MRTKDSQFKDELVKFFSDPKCEKTSWGKNEVAKKVLELWGNYLEKEIERMENRTQPVKEGE